MKTWTMRLVVVTTSMLLVTSPAHADDELQLSHDGSSWSDGLTGGLFDPAVLWVPGDVRTATFFVRNRTEDTGTVTVDLHGSAVDSLMRTGDLAVAARAGASRWCSVSTPGDHRIATSHVPAGAQEKVSVRVSFDPRATNASRVKQLRLAFDVRLSRTIDARDTSGGRCDVKTGDDGTSRDAHGHRVDDQGGLEASDGHGLLPDTGSPFTLLGLLAATVMVLGGARLVARRREVGHE